MIAYRSAFVVCGLLVLGCSADPAPTDSGSTTTSGGDTGPSEASSATSSTDDTDGSGDGTIATTTTSDSDGTTSGSSDSGDGSSSESTGEPPATCPHDDAPASAAGTLDWAFDIGTQVRVADLVTDDLDNVIMTGALIQADFGEGPIDTGGQGAVYVAKYDPDGELLWVFVSATPAGASALVVDAAGDVIVGTNYESASLTKLDGASGEPIWTVAIEDPVVGQLDVGELALAPNGDVIATAFIWDENNEYYSFLARVDGDGTTLWTRELVSSGGVWGVGVAYSDDGIAWLGVFSGTLELESGDLVTTDSFGAISLALVRFDDDGIAQWGVASEPSDVLDVYPRGFASDPCGGFYAYGNFRGTLAFDGVDPLVNETNGDTLFFVRFDASGTAEWARQYGSSAISTARKIAVDSEGSVILTGGIRGADFGSEHFEFDTHNGFVAMINREGDALWAEAFESDGQTSNVAAVDSQGRVIVVGDYDTSVTIDGTVLEGGPSYDNDLYVAAFDF